MFLNLRLTLFGSSGHEKHAEFWPKAWSGCAKPKQKMQSLLFVQFNRADRWCQFLDDSSLPVFPVVEQDPQVEEEHEHEGEDGGGDEAEPERVVSHVGRVLTDVRVAKVHAALRVVDSADLEKSEKKTKAILDEKKGPRKQITFKLHVVGFGFVFVLGADIKKEKRGANLINK